jgi:molecular chaperone GrpE (heat shock protein)
MKNKVEELAVIINQVKEDLNLKEQLLVLQDDFDSQERISNIKKRITALEEDAKEIKERYADKPDFFINFRRRAGEIVEEIEAMD